MRKSLIMLVVGAVVALAVTGPLLLKKQAEARRLAVEKDQLQATLGDAEKRALDAEDRLGRQEGELERLRRGQEELLQLRGEVTQLRQAGKEAAAAAARLKASAPKPGANQLPPPPPEPPVADETSEPEEAAPFGIGVFKPAGQCKFAGFNTPEQVLETLQWALHNGKTDTAEQVFLPVDIPAGDPSVVVGGPDTLPDTDGAAPGEPGGSAATQPNPLRASAQGSGYTVVGGVEVGADEVRLMVRNHHPDGSLEDVPLTFRRVGTGWRIAPTVIPVSTGTDVDLQAP